MDTKEGFPVRFTSPEDPCDDYDEREYCQMVEQGDRLEFAWDAEPLGEETVICFIPEEDPECSFGDAAITGAGLWKICVTLIFGAIPPAGTISVTAAGVTSEVVPAVPGTICFWVTTEMAGDIDFNLVGTTAGYQYATVARQCTDYIVQIRNLNGGLIDSFTDDDFDGDEGIFMEDGIVYLKTTWESLGLEDGCYKICIVQDCCGVGDELILNKGFDSGANWTIGTGWSIGSGVASYDGITTGNLTQIVDIKAYTTYALVFNYISINIDSILEVFVGGASIGVVTATTQWVSIVLTTGAEPITDTIVFKGYGNGVFDPHAFQIDNVTLKTMEVQCSPCYNLKEDQGCTKLLSWTNDDDAFGIPYGSINFTNYLRVIAFVEKPRYPEESDRFIFSDGRRKILYATSEKIWTLKFDDLPQYLHDAIALMKIHDHVYIDGVEYICVAGNYEPEWRGRNKAAQSKIEVQKIIDNNKNKNC